MDSRPRISCSDANRANGEEEVRTVGVSVNILNFSPVIELRNVRTFGNIVIKLGVVPCSLFSRDP